MNEINQTFDINKLSLIKFDKLPAITFRDRLNRLKQNIKFKYLPFRLYHRIRCYKYAKYRSPELSLISNLVKNNQNSIDIGANLGLFTFFMSRASKHVFAFEPNPYPLENLKDLVQEIKKGSYDLGIAFDGDGDRVGVVDEKGEIIWSDQLLSIFLPEVIKNGEDILFDVKCSQSLEDMILKYGGNPVMWKTGHSLIKKKMMELNCKLGGEMSGHIFFADRWGGFDDGIYASLRLLEILCREGDNLGILNTLPKSITTPEINIPFNGNNHFTFMNLFAKLAKFNNASIIDIDGIKIIYPDSWGLIRCSNTTSNLVLRFEADDIDAMSKIQSLVRDEILKIDNKLELPF